MTEQEAQTWIAERFGDAALSRIRMFLDQVVAENRVQNLISPSSVGTIWTRHALDSAQLLALAPEAWRSWLDVGTGGGFPAMIVALLAPERLVYMTEPRRKRADFLRHCTELFGLRQTNVLPSKVEKVEVTADVISARAVASMENLLHAAGHCATTRTTWLLPRGRSGAADVEQLQRLQPSMFHVEHSLTDAESTILVIRGTGR